MDGGSETRPGVSSRPAAAGGFPPGTLLAERYRIVALAGRGVTTFTRELTACFTLTVSQSVLGAGRCELQHGEHRPVPLDTMVADR
jgi:hypothetical protein